MIRRVAALAAAALVLTIPATATPAAAAAKPPSGSYKVKVVSVTDGDTIRVRYQGRSTPVRLIGLNAPETTQCYGSHATSRMRELTKGGYVWMKADGSQGQRDKYNRLLRHLYTSGGRSLAVIQIQEGRAREYTYNRAYAGQYTHRRAQASAKAGKRGLWRSCATAPRPRTTVAPKPKPRTTSTCRIKGNISSSGRIYHLPGQRLYSVTKIDTSKGERWFCSETQARNAGWRKSKV